MPYFCFILLFIYTFYTNIFRNPQLFRGSCSIQSNVGTLKTMALLSKIMTGAADLSPVLRVMSSLCCQTNELNHFYIKLFFFPVIGQRLNVSECTEKLIVKMKALSLGYWFARFTLEAAYNK